MYQEMGLSPAVMVFAPWVRREATDVEAFVVLSGS